MMSNPTPQTDGHLLPLLYAGDTYGWERGMARLSMALLAGLPLRTDPTILEIGCGAGALLRSTTTRYPDGISIGIDLNLTALSHAQQRDENSLLGQVDLHNLPFADNRFDLLLGLDAFDQNGVDLARALAEAKRVLQPGGYLLLRVSAHAWLYGAHDVAFNTGKRFGRQELVAMLRNADFQITRVSYANSLLAAPVIALRLAQNLRPADEEQQIYQSSIANQLVEHALTFESRLLRSMNLPFGLTLIVVAQARSTDHNEA